MPRHIGFLYFCTVKNHLLYMQRCLQLAEKGRGYTGLNPMVGCVIVHNDSIIGEGFHKKYGMPHAEVEAVHSVSDMSLLSSSVLYVSLEPCCHQGKTPPCTSLIISHKIPTVVVAVRDPNPKVGGKGIELLRSAGIEVIENVLSDDAQALNVRFFTYHNKKRPYVILKWAQSADGFLDCEPCSNDYRQNWISNEYSTQIVHKWRAEEMGILVGRTTAQRDNPSLTTRLWDGNHPVKILIDPKLKILHDSNIYNVQSPLVVIHDIQMETPLRKFSHVTYRGIDFLNNVAQAVLNVLFEEGINSVIVEGGRMTLDTFLTSGLWDEARIIHGKTIFKKGTQAPLLKQTPYKKEIIGCDCIEYYKNCK